MSTPTTRTTNKTGVAAWFEVSPQAVDGWIRRGCPAVQIGKQGQPWLFDLLTVAQWRFSGAATSHHPGAGDDPTNMTPHDRLNHWKAVREETKHREEAGQLLPASDYERALSSALKTVAMTLESLPDVLERDAGISGAAVEACQRTIDRVREDLYLRLTAD